jgi:hypothetical protein
VTSGLNHGSAVRLNGAATDGNLIAIRPEADALCSLEVLSSDPLRATGIPRSVALIDISIWGVSMDRRCILGLFATALISVPAIPDIAIAQGKSLNDQLVGTWIYVSSTAKRADGSSAPRPQLQGAVTYTADGHFHFITVPVDLPKIASGDRLKPTPEEAKAVATGVIAYTGTYTLDESTKTVHPTVVTSTFPNMVASDQSRIVTSVTADELRLTNPGGSGGLILELVFKRAK